MWVKVAVHIARKYARRIRGSIPTEICTPTRAHILHRIGCRADQIRCRLHNGKLLDGGNRLLNPCDKVPHIPDCRLHRVIDKVCCRLKSIGKNINYRRNRLVNLCHNARDKLNRCHTEVRDNLLCRVPEIGGNAIDIVPRIRDIGLHVQHDVKDGIEHARDHADCAVDSALYRRENRDDGA